MLPALKTGDSVGIKEIQATERFTQPPPRFSEASLVKKMEELGIGRPSTYAPTISVIQGRGYVEKAERQGEERSFVQLSLKGTEADQGVSISTIVNEHHAPILHHTLEMLLRGRFRNTGPLSS